MGNRLEEEVIPGVMFSFTRYEEAGKLGLSQAIMERSDPKGMAEFDQLVDEFNAELPRIVREQDNGAVQVFFRRAGDLKKPRNNQPPLE